MLLYYANQMSFIISYKEYNCKMCTTKHVLCLITHRLTVISFNLYEKNTAGRCDCVFIVYDTLYIYSLHSPTIPSIVYICTAIYIAPIWVCPGLLCKHDLIGQYYINYVLYIILLQLLISAIKYYSPLMIKHLFCVL